MTNGLNETPKEYNPEYCHYKHELINKDTEEKIILHLCYVHALIINNAIERVINEPTQS
ncbi:hypothetical protein LCGC14_2371040 [marine sediment metagenome]|uniref:Uncharacterized protein n=1 Tax=marine sediment metagenome TaxID=412755 RepID=A0A0F9EGA3_9ZZZZ